MYLCEYFKFCLRYRLWNLLVPLAVPYHWSSAPEDNVAVLRLVVQMLLFAPAGAPVASVHGAVARLVVITVGMNDSVSFSRPSDYRAELISVCTGK